MSKTMSEALSVTKPTADKPIDNALVDKVGWAIYFASRKVRLIEDEIEEISPAIIGVTKAAIQAYEAHLAEQGLVVVPREPTDKMKLAGSECYDANWGYAHGSGIEDDWANDSWKAMITASQGE